MDDVIRIDCFVDSLVHRVSTIYVKDTATNLPEDFFVGSPVWGTRILVTGDAMASTLVFGSWNMIIQKPENVEWSVLLSILGHLRSPRLLVVDVGVALPTRLLSTLVSRGLESLDTTIVLYRSLTGSEPPVCSHVCFLPPVVEQPIQSRILTIAAAICGTGSNAGVGANQEQLTKVYQELVPKSMWMVLQLVAGGKATLHWHQPGAIEDDNLITRFKNLSHSLAGLFHSIGSR